MDGCHASGYVTTASDKCFNLSRAGEIGKVIDVSGKRVQVEAAGGKKWWYDQQAVHNLTPGVGSKVRLVDKYKIFSDAADGPLKPGGPRRFVTRFVA